MRYGFVGLAAVIAAGAALVAQSPSNSPAKAPAKSGATKKAYTPPKTPWGDPDLQGLWPGSFQIPVERDKALGERATLNAKEFADREKKAKGQEGRNFGVEYFPASDQASLIVDPPNGRLPEMIPEAKKRMKEMRDGLGPPTLAGVEKRADSWLDFDIWGRCITKGLLGSLLPGNFYNKGNQIVQAPGYVVLRNEMVHENRIIPVDARPHVGSNYKVYMGDGKGHWEGNTLVVETTNFKDNLGMTGFNQSHTTDQLKIVERITRVAADELSYDVTVSDPGTWTRPWTMHIPYKMDNEYKIYEYACHESNYGLLDILKGYRAAEAKAAPKD
jgi:hypothetical protein